MKLRLFPLLVAVAAASFLLKAGAVWQGVGALAEVKPPTADSQAAGSPPAGTAAGGGSPVGAGLSSDPFALTDEEIARDVQRYALRRVPHQEEPAAALAYVGEEASPEERKGWGIIEID